VHGIFPFCFPAVLVLRLQVWGRQRNLAGKVLYLIQDRLADAEFGKNLANLSTNSPPGALNVLTPRI